MTILLETLLETNSSETEIDIEILPGPGLKQESPNPNLLMTIVGALFVVLAAGFCCVILWLQIRSRVKDNTHTKDDESESRKSPIYKPSHSINKSRMVNYSPVFTSEVMHPSITRMVEAPAYLHHITDTPPHSESNYVNSRHQLNTIQE